MFTCSQKTMASKHMAINLFSIAKQAKHQVTIGEAKKWQTHYNCEYHSLTWLKYDEDNQDYKSSACTKFNISI